MWRHGRVCHRIHAHDARQQQAARFSASFFVFFLSIRQAAAIDLRHFGSEKANKSRARRLQAFTESQAPLSKVIATPTEDSVQSPLTARDDAI